MSQSHPPVPDDLLENPSVPVDRRGVDELAEVLSGCSFSKYRRREIYRENIREGHAEYNTGGVAQDALRHSPHTLDQCRRKQWYREHDTIQETSPPEGIFETGTWIEEEIIVPWLDDVARKTGWYLQNDIWVDATVESDTGELQLAGKTDPAFVDDGGVPEAITEIKSKASLANLQEPSRQHKAQLHAYLHAAQKQFDLDESPAGYIIYVGKKRFDVAVFQVEFDEAFFEDVVVEWCRKMSQARIEDSMPPAEPCHDWECKLCEFRERCGAASQASGVFEDTPTGGMLPLTEYPRDSVIEYLQANPDSQLTPTVAYQFPQLADQYPVPPWRCRRCEAEYDWDFPDWDGDVEQPPWCPRCRRGEGRFVGLSGPIPHQ